MASRKVLVALSLVLAASAGLLAGEPSDSVALRGATIYTAVGPPIQKGTILMEGGKIIAVGTDVKIPAGAKVVDLTGKVIIPGMIDAHSHIGFGEYRAEAEFAEPMGPELRVLDALNMEQPAWTDAVRGGVTTVVAIPGSGADISGQAIILKTFGRTLEERILRESGEMKMVVGWRTITHWNTIRGTFIKAREYMEAWQRYEASDKKGSPPKRDLGLEAMVRVLKRQDRVRAHVHLAHDIVSLLKLKDEFDLDLTLEHSTEAYLVADEVARRSVSAVVLPLSMRLGFLDEILAGNATLQQAGVKIAMHTDHPVSQQKWLRFCAAMSMRYGLREDEALKTITINPAEIARISNRVGSIEKGKDADLVVFDGPWYEPKSRVDMVFVNGVLAYDRAQEEKEERLAEEK